MFVKSYNSELVQFDIAICLQNTNEIYATVMEVAASSVMKEKAIEMKKAIDNQMTWESIVRRIEDLV